ncbi:hypothetical protein TWF569_001346 [Orbilia oligospora]|uniref:NmrA-like domain-containing protein n=1 Tax=Orbilia oligospora TaxID=2813651 RepID=A0A7C8J644_ORBOL|nr:hypothetical protein TWF103_001632 [Orbilia oligospora]KAF3097052.1 hypothetical protein TWF102_006490 [Orbilia oligospora]KAF3110213.1 hypothetical protein TWF706_000938 [Orbilia oligospora]KAF3124148.1 hypothetical protein TWF569_001346 [Orbilia oligospora]KAF3131065.1 hypothetical protein TWF594_010139 [Orbilia oligospora]
MAIKNILLIGGSGNVGTPILAAITAEPSLNVTVLTREDSKSTFPPGTVVKKADYKSHESLVAAFKGHDTIVSNVATLAAIDQLPFVEAAVEAGVTRFYPTEYGSIASSDGDIVQEFWDRVGFHGKYEVYLRLKELADAGKIEYTLITSGPFFDWGLQFGFVGLNLKEKKATIFGSGNQVVAVSNLSHIAKAVVWTLTHPEESKNKTIRFWSYKITQPSLLAVAEKITGTKWEVENIPVDDYIKTAEEGKKAGNPYAGYQVLQGLIFDEQDKYGSNYKVNDIPFEDDRKIEDVVAEALKPFVN